ncbi:hypothetical protein U0070_000421, partial [Myodes glareolus]
LGSAVALEPFSPSSARHISLLGVHTGFQYPNMLKQPELEHEDAQGPEQMRIQCERAGPTPDKLNIYDFETLYDKIYNDLLKKDRAFSTQNGIALMQDRNESSKDLFAVTFTCEEHVYDQLMECLNAKEQGVCQLVHVISVSVPDNYEEATLGPLSSVSSAIVSSKWDMKRKKEVHLPKICQKLHFLLRQDANIGLLP